MTVRELIVALLGLPMNSLVTLADPVDGGMADLSEVVSVCRCARGELDYVDLRS